METNHTRTKTQILNSKGVVTTNFRENLIGVFEAMEEYANEKNKEMEADAKLIAAAPELLKALQRVILNLKFDNENLKYCIEQAIKKATE